MIIDKSVILEAIKIIPRTRQDITNLGSLLSGGPSLVSGGSRFSTIKNSAIASGIASAGVATISGANAPDILNIGGAALLSGAAGGAIMHGRKDNLFNASALPAALSAGTAVAINNVSNDYNIDPLTSAALTGGVGALSYKLRTKV